MSGPAAAGELRGRVVVTRGLTKKRVNLPQYEQRGAAVYEPPASSVTDEFQKIVVYLEGADPQPGPPQTVLITQKNRQFEPDVAVIPAGSSVTFPNADVIFHNVFSLSKAKSFDLGHYPAGQSRTVLFRSAGVVQVYCRLHPNMSAAVLVVPNRYYARPDTAGNFELGGVPPGDYRMVTWHKSAGTQTNSVRVPAAGVVEVSVLFPIVDKK